MRKLAYILATLPLVIACGTGARVHDGASRSGDEQMVNVGYGSVKKSDLTSSVSSVDMKDMELQSYNNIYDYLQGKVAGLIVTSDHRIIIRGINTIYASTDPLILVDGVEVHDLEFLHPGDVKSVDVIKDGSAAIYGSRGANGVIIITTKR